MVDVRAARKAAIRQKKQINRFKGKYAGPDKYKGVVPPHLRHKYKGKYFGKESNKGSNVTEDVMTHINRGRKDRKSSAVKKPGTPEVSIGFGTEPGGVKKPIPGKGPFKRPPGKGFGRPSFPGKGPIKNPRFRSPFPGKGPTLPVQPGVGVKKPMPPRKLPIKRPMAPSNPGSEVRMY